MGDVKKYLSLIKFSHTVFALPFALIGFFLAVSQPQYSFTVKDFLLVLGCMLFARSAAMAFNRYIDSNIDKKNLRTAGREIPAGIISKKNAFLFVILNAVAFAVCAGFLNRLCLFLSPVALLVILGYSYTKRFTWLCHFILGLGLSLAPIGAYVAVTEHFSLVPILFSCAVLTWVSGFDIIYALQDEEFDKKEQLFSVPVFMGKKNALLLSSVVHGVTAAIILLIGAIGNFGTEYWIGAVFFIAMLIYQHLLVKPNDLSRVNLAFMTTNGIASIIFGLFVISDLLLF